MLGVTTIIEFIFSIALFINALLFIPQAIKIFREKTAESISLFTFVGFFLIQLATILHGFMNHDYLLMLGYLLSMITCGSVIALKLFYKNRDRVCAEVNISFQDILEQLPGHIYWKNKEGVLLGCNKNNWKDFGLSSLSHIKGKTDYDIFCKEEADQLRIFDEEVMRTGGTKVMEEPLTVDGKTFLYLSHKVPLKNKHGEVIGVLGNSVDITNSKQEVLDKLEMLEDIIAVMPGNVYWMNAKGVYLGCNDNEARAVGLASREEIIGKRNVDMPGFVIPLFLDDVNKAVMKSGKSVVVEEPATLQDGTEATFLSSKVPLRNKEGDITGMVGISIDITERKKSEEALKTAKKMIEIADEAKTEFLCNMQHDLRTPFSGVLGLSEFMESTETDPEKKKILSMIVESAHTLLNQLNEIFEFLKVENAQLPILEKEFDLHELLNELFRMMRPSAKDKQLDFTLTIRDNLPKIVIGDRVRTQRVLMNLIANAIKFTQEGYVKVVARSTSEGAGGAVISFVIEDTGIGIPEDKREIIFERFTRLTPAYSGVYAGKGLGLRIVKQLLDEIEGQPYLDSEVGKGTTFKILIPYKLPLLDFEEDEVENSQALPQSSHLEKESATEKQPATIENMESDDLEDDRKQATRKSCILLVEDHAVSAKVAANILLSLHCQVDIAENGKAALSLVQNNFYDLIFMDIGLPDMSGYEVAHRIRSNTIRSIAHVPIIALTAHADGDNKQNCINVSMNAVITKPLTPKQAETILDTFIPLRKKYVDRNELKEQKTVDFEYAKKVTNGNETVIFDTLRMLIDSLPAELKELEEAFQQKDWETLQSIAHKLKGGCSYCGALGLKCVCAEMEEYIKSGLTTRIPQIYKKLLREADALKKFMEDENIKVGSI